MTSETPEIQYVCRKCGRDVTFNNLGDDETKFFKCDECGIINETKVEPKNIEVPNIKYEPPENPTDRNILVQRLKEVNLSTRRFLKVGENKAAFELEWEKHLYGPEDLPKYPRCGICGKDGLVLCDVDKPEMIKVFREQLPETLVAVSPRRGLPHFYYKVVGGEVPNKTLRIPEDYDEEGRPVGAGEIRSQNEYLVAPGTTIKYKDLKTGEPKIGTYKITENRQIATVTFERFMEVIKPCLGKDSSQKITREIMEKGVGQGTRHAYGIKYATRLIRFEHLDPVAALDVMKRWNQKCKPPMAENDLERMVKNAVGYTQGDILEDKIKGKTKKTSNDEKLVSEDVSDVFAYSGDVEFTGRIQIKSIGNPQSRFTRLKFSCYPDDSEKCENCKFSEFTLSLNENFDASAFATYFDTNEPKLALLVLKQKDIINGGCKKIQVKGEEERSITQTIISDRVGNEAKAWFVHSKKCDLRKKPNWIFSKGWLCRGAKGRIGVFVKEFVAESEVMKPDDETIKKSKKYLQSRTSTDKPTVEKVAEAFQRKTNLKGKEVVRGFTADFVTIGSPVWTKTPEGPRILAMTSAEIGKTTTAKSQRVREETDWIKAGKYGSGKMTTAGIAAGSEKVEGIGWVVKKGLLPSADLSFVILDNMHPKALDDFIESRRNGIIMINSIQGDTELWARTRLKLLCNPKISVDSNVQKCITLKMYSRKWIARLTFAIFTYGVTTKTRYTPEITELTEGDELLLKSAWNVLRWNLSQERTYTVRREHWPKIMELSEELENKFGNEDIPLLLRSIPHKLATLASCFALFEGEDEPKERHIDQAYQWLNDCAVDIELDEYTALWKEENILLEEEYKNLETAVNNIITDEQKSGGTVQETDTYGFLEKLAKQGQAPMEEIAASLKISEPTVKRRAKTMKGLGLIKSSKEGYYFTVKGVKFWKIWIRSI